MCQFEKLRRAILYDPNRDSGQFVNYPIRQTARTFEFSDVAFREILTGLANAGFIELNFEGDACAQVRLPSNKTQMKARGAI